MGMLATVMKSAEGLLWVSGTGTPGLVPQESLDELVEHHQSLGLGSPVPCSLEDPVVALWIGREFEHRASALGLTLPKTTGLPHTDLPQGWIGLSSPSEVFALLERWTREAFAIAVGKRMSAVALLMTLVLPDHPLTRAALWYTADETGRAHELAWFLRIDRDVGKKSTAATLEQEFADACAKVLTASAGDSLL